MFPCWFCCFRVCFVALFWGFEFLIWLVGRCWLLLFWGVLCFFFFVVVVVVVVVVVWGFLYCLDFLLIFVVVF